MRKFVLLAVLLAACSVKAEIVGPDTPVISNPESCHPMIVPMGDVYRYLYAPRVCSRVPVYTLPPPPPEPIVVPAPSPYIYGGYDYYYAPSYYGYPRYSYRGYRGRR